MSLSNEIPLLVRRKNGTFGMTITGGAVLRQVPSLSDIPMHGWAPYDAVHRERVRADAKHSTKGNSMEQRPPDDAAWLPVLVEEVGEVARALCDHDPLQHLREELVQVAAMACAWIESVDEAIRRERVAS